MSGDSHMSPHAPPEAAQARGKVPRVPRQASRPPRPATVRGPWRTRKLVRTAKTPQEAWLLEHFCS